MKAAACPARRQVKLVIVGKASRGKVLKYSGYQ